MSISLDLLQLILKERLITDENTITLSDINVIINETKEAKDSPEYLMKKLDSYSKAFSNEISYIRTFENHHHKLFFIMYDSIYIIYDSNKNELIVNYKLYEHLLYLCKTNYDEIIYIIKYIILKNLKIHTPTTKFGTPWYFDQLENELRFITPLSSITLDEYLKEK